MGDDRDRERKGFWSGLFRSQSLARRGKLEKEQPRRASDGDAMLQRRRTDPVEKTRPAAASAPAPGPARRRPPRADPRDVKGKGREEPNDNGSDTGPLAEWPPSGMSSQEELTLGQAMELICRGVPLHKGHKRAVPHVSDHYYSLYATSAGNRGDESDAASLHDSMVQLMTLKIHNNSPAKYPWETLEQPSYTFWYGRMPGTITFNQWVATSSVLPGPLALRDSGVRPREIDLLKVFERLKELEQGLEDDDPEYMYRTLYRRLLRDPDKLLSPHKTLDKQITDLILVLSRPDWIDFTNPKNHVATRFIFDRGQINHQQYLKFFHQLLLSLELDLRINSKQHSDWAKDKLLPQIPPTIKWDIAIARRWRENVRIEDFGRTADQMKMRYKLKKRQVRMLKRFAQMMKWPNLQETLDNLKQRDTDNTLDEISSDALAFFSGLVLPGPTFPFLIMNTLIDVDPDKATDDLALLTHLHPQCGFQYRNSYTYWSAVSIVGKVLAPTCLSVAGWIGPARPTADLGRSQIARIRSRRPRQRLSPEDMKSMAERSDPLGPEAKVYPVSEYSLATPDADDIVDTVRIELLGLKASADRAGESGPGWFDATVQFAIDGISWPLRLMYDVSFVTAWPCSYGPHPLFFDYVHTTVKADDIVTVRDWGGLYAGDPRSTRSSPAVGMSAAKAARPTASELVNEAEKVLVVEAFGVTDNEVLARAWCSHWGLSAIVADIRKTCMACAIRQAYAGTLTVVILIEDPHYEENE